MSASSNSWPKSQSTSASCSPRPHVKPWMPSSRQWRRLLLLRRPLRWTLGARDVICRHHWDDAPRTCLVRESTRPLRLSLSGLAPLSRAAVWIKRTYPVYPSIRQWHTNRCTRQLGSLPTLRRTDDASRSSSHPPSTEDGSRSGAALPCRPPLQPPLPLPRRCLRAPPSSSPPRHGVGGSHSSSNSSLRSTTSYPRKTRTGR